MNDFEGLQTLAFEIIPTKNNISAPYIQCNESNQAAILKNISQQMTDSSNTLNNRLHVGFSVWFNLDVIATTKPHLAIIMDIDPNVHIVYQVFQEAILEADTVQDFITKFSQKLGQNDVLQFGDVNSQENSLKKECNKAVGFLSSLTSYLVVKQMVKEQKIFFCDMNILDENKINKIKSWKNDKGLQINTLYLSNIPEWIMEYENQKNKDKLISNIRLLVDPNTVVIDAFYPSADKSNSSGPPLRLTTQKIPDFVKAKAVKKVNKRKVDLDMDYEDYNDFHTNSAPLKLFNSGKKQESPPPETTSTIKKPF